MLSPTIEQPVKTLIQLLRYVTGWPVLDNGKVAPALIPIFGKRVRALAVTCVYGTPCRYVCAAQTSAHAETRGVYERIPGGRP